MATDIVLLGLWRAELERAKRDYKASSLCQVFTSVASGAVVLLNVEAMTYGVTVAAVLLSAASAYFSYLGSKRKGAAERGRRASLLIEGLGLSITSKERSDIVSCLEASESEAHRWENSEFYSGDHEPGVARLAHIVQESSFYSKALFAEAAQRCWRWVAASGVLTISIMFGLPYVSSTKASLEIAQLVCLALSLLTTRDLIGRALTFQGASQTAGEVDHRLERTTAVFAKPEDILFVIGDYNAVLECTPPIDTSVYERLKEKLEAGWNSRNPKV